MEKGASAPILLMDMGARAVCMAARSGVVMGHDEVKKISEMLRDCFAPETADSTNQEVICFLQF